MSSTSRISKIFGASLLATLPLASAFAADTNRGIRDFCNSSVVCAYVAINGDVFRVEGNKNDIFGSAPSVQQYLLESQARREGKLTASVAEPEPHETADDSFGLAGFELK